MNCNRDKKLNSADMAKGCINRICVTTDKEELYQLTYHLYFHIRDVLYYKEQESVDKINASTKENW